VYFIAQLPGGLIVNLLVFVCPLGFGEWNVAIVCQPDKFGWFGSIVTSTAIETATTAAVTIAVMSQPLRDIRLAD
jgi:hypothetical protein